MFTIYFSGTGNTKYVAENFSKLLQADCHSIEERIDFQELIINSDTIAICYPIYGSCVPYIMREFIIEHKAYLNGKRLIILCIQNLFSGDGARVLTDLLNDINYDVIYAEHFNMPNNICNVFFYPLSSDAKVRKYLANADKKIVTICDYINKGIVRKRGFNALSRYLGFITQRLYFNKVEQKAKNNVRINSDCISCMLCVDICPMQNLKSVDNKIIPKGNCTLCYRCVNKCPSKAITVFVHGKVKKQYAGINETKIK